MARQPCTRLAQGIFRSAGADAGIKILAKGLVGARDFAFTLDRAARGLGKTLWWGPFKIQFYGLRAGA